MKYICIFIIIFIGLQTYLIGSFSYIPYSAKASSLGGAISTEENSAETLFFNPAGIGYKSKKNGNIAFLYSPMFIGLSDAISSFGGSVYYNIKNFISAGAFFSLFGNSIYKEQQLGITVAKEIASSFSAGVSFKLLSKILGSNDYLNIDPVVNYGAKSSVSAFSFDVGILYGQEKIKVALSILNINAPDIAFTTSDIIYRSYRLGIKYVESKKLSLSSDISYRNDSINAGGGVEYKFFKFASVMVGYNQQQVSTGFSVYYNLNSLGIQLDYSFGYSIVLMSLNNHYLTLKVNF